jgi:inner membrane protein involved in colicin E2 resistance
MREAVIVLAVIGAAMVMASSWLGASRRVSSEAASRLHYAGYTVTGLSIVMFLYLGFTRE